MRKVILPLLIISLATFAAGQVTYDVDADREEVDINVSAKLECPADETNCPVNSWRLEWKIPENAEVMNISDSLGEIEDYQVDNQVVNLETNQGLKREEEKVTFQLEIDREAEQKADGLYTRKLSLPSLQSENTSGEIIVPDLISGTITSGFQNSFSNNSMRFRGQGASNVVLNFGEGTQEDEYVFFGEPGQNVSLAYDIAVGTTGLSQSYPQIPVQVLSDGEYDSESYNWSEGQYRQGLITMREDLEERFPAVLAEETVHAFNDEALSFDRTRSSWLDEGLAGYTQAMVSKSLVGSRRTREIFGDDNSYMQDMQGSFYEVTKSSKGNPEKLWKYYQNKRDFMESWSPESPENRGFGYAYSELIVRNHVAKNNSVRDIYSEIEPRVLETDEGKWSYYSQFLELEPCNYDSRERFDSCLQRINNYDYPVYIAKELPESNQSQINVKEIKVPNNTQTNSKNQLIPRETLSSLIQKIAKFLETL